MTAEERAYKYASTQKASKFQVGEIAKFYNDGYRQAVKNLELTWKDIEIIGELRLNVALEFRRKELESSINNPFNFTKEDICQEVLKRFKNRKENKV